MSGLEVIIPIAAGAYFHKIYNRKNAPEREINDPDPKKGDCGTLTTSSPNKKWIPFKGGLLRSTPKCALCPSTATTIELHRIGNNECIGGSDKTARKRVKYTKQRSAGAGSTRYYKIAVDGTKTRLSREDYTKGKERQAGCDMRHRKKKGKKKRQ